MKTLYALISRSKDVENKRHINQRVRHKMYKVESFSISSQKKKEQKKKFL